jgi:hypothetical protein
MGINTFSQLLMVMFQSSICEVTLPQNVSKFNSVKLHCPKIIAFLLFFRHLSLMILMLSFNGHACKKSEIPSAIWLHGEGHSVSLTHQTAIWFCMCVQVKSICKIQYAILWSCKIYVYFSYNLQSIQSAKGFSFLYNHSFANLVEP